MSNDEIKVLLKKYNLKALKQLGQHFLIDKKVLLKIVNTAKLTKEDSVLEIGPGLGILTEALVLRAGKVIAIEIDRGLVKYLRKKFKDHKNIEIVHGDILKIQNSEFKIQNYKVVANLPYYITSRVIRHFLEDRRLKPTATKEDSLLVAAPFRVRREIKAKPTLMVLLIQKEVAERIVAKPPKMSLLSCSVQFYGKPEIVDFVPKESFWPKPKVESAILRINVYKEPRVKVKDKKLFFQVIKAGFSNKRKQLHNALAGGLHISNEEAKDLLRKSGIDPARRAQTLSLEEWAKLSPH